MLATQNLSSFFGMRIFIKSQFRKLFWNLENHITLLLSAAALLGLFYYIFQDFMRGELSKLEPIWADRGLLIGAMLSVLTSSFILGRWHQSLFLSNDSLLPVMNRLGISSDEKKSYVLLNNVLFIVLNIISTFFISWLFKLENPLPALIFGLITTFAAKHVFLPTRLGKLKEFTEIKDWRRHQLLHRSMPGKNLLRLGVISSLLIPIAAMTGTKIILLQLASLLCGLIITFGIVHAVAAELPGSWFEKQAGYTHEDWIKSWQHIANFFALILCTCSLLTLLLMHSPNPHDLWSLPFISAFLPWLTPSIILQIDARSKNVNLLLVLILALFLGTAMIATPWAAIALPIIQSQAKAYQKGRFYRA